MVSIFLVFEAPQVCWDIHLNPLKTIVNLHLLGSMELIKCQDVDVGLDLFFAFSNGDSSDVCHRLCYSQGKLPTSEYYFGCVQSFMWICSAFGSVENFHFEDVFCLPTAVHLDKQVSIPWLFSCFVE